MPLSQERKDFLAELLKTPSKQHASNLKPRLVLDTNVWLDLFYWDDAEIRFLKPLIESNSVVVFSSDDTLRELAEVLDRDSFKKSFDEVSLILQTYYNKTVRVDEESLKVAAEELHVKCKDPLDQKFLVLALASQTHYLVSKDKLVLKAGKKLRRLGIEVVTPGLLDMLLR